eukprot:3222325-Amphidinium_carterae.2
MYSIWGADRVNCKYDIGHMWDTSSHPARRSANSSMVGVTMGKRTSVSCTYVTRTCGSRPLLDTRHTLAQSRDAMGSMVVLANSASDATRGAWILNVP